MGYTEGGPQGKRLTCGVGQVRAGAEKELDSAAVDILDPQGALQRELHHTVLPGGEGACLCTLVGVSGAPWEAVGRANSSHCTEKLGSLSS